MNDTNTEIVAKKSFGFGRKIFLILILLIIFIMIGAGIFFLKNVYRINNNQDEQIKSLLVRINRLENQQLAPMQKKAELNNDIMAITECLNLLRAANFILLTNGDYRNALQLLSNARSISVQYPSFFALTNALNKDILLLERVANSNSEDQILLLEKLQQQIISSPQANFISGTESNTSETAKETKSIQIHQAVNLKSANWFAVLQTVEHSIADALQNLVIISEHQQPVNMLLSKEEFSNLSLLIELKFMQAEFALMHKQVNLYKTCLSNIENLLNVYYRQNVLMKTNVLKQLHEMENLLKENQEININSSITAANNILKNILNTSNQQTKEQIIPAKSEVSQDSAMEYRT